MITIEDNSADTTTIISSSSGVDINVVLPQPAYINQHHIITNNGTSPILVAPQQKCAITSYTHSWSESSTPSVSIKKHVSELGLEKFTDKMWRVRHLSFKELIALQESGIKYSWTQIGADIFMTFESDADESQAIMIIGSVPYDQ